MQTQQPTLNPALKDFWLAKARNKILYGGRASSKSWDAAGFVIFLAQQCKIRVLCARQLQNKIEESVYSLLKIQIERFKLQHLFTILNNKIICNSTGSEFLFYGLWRNISEIKSLEDIDICWIEEAHALTQEQWEILEPTIRKEGSQFWIIFNPLQATDFIYQKFVVNTPPDTIVRKINYTENPFLSNTMLKIIEDAKEENFERYKHIYLGEPITDNERAIIKRSWIQAAIKADLGELHALKTAGLDVADQGEDLNALCIRRGAYVESIESFKCETTTITTRQAFIKCMQADCRTLAYDAIGVGAGVRGESRELEKTYSIRTIAINVANSPTEQLYDGGRTGKELFQNLKMELWWRVRERFRKTWEHFNNIKSHKADELISIPNDPELIEELCTPYIIFNNTNGKMQVESKKDLAARGVKSPNKADALMLSFAENATIVRNYNTLIESKY